MPTARALLFLGLAVAFTGSVIGQDKKKDDPKAEPKAKGFLPTYWRDLGLSDAQKQEVYKIQAKYGDEIDVLEAKIKELKGKMAKERMTVLTPEQKKRLEEIVKEKTGTGDK
jgi:hypothetical protein